MAFSQMEIQNNLGKVNTDHYEYHKLEDTQDNREKVADEPASKREVDELKQMLKKNEEKDRQQEASLQKAETINNNQDRRLDMLGSQMQGSESEISLILAQNGLNYNEATGMFADANPTKEPGARIFGANTAELEARQA